MWKFNKSIGIINIIKPSLVQKHTHTRLYKTLARPVLCYGSETWTLRKNEENRITASEMKFMHWTAGYTKLNHQRNEDILQELGLETVLQYAHQYHENWFHHVKSMPRSRIPRVVLNYRPSEA